MSNGCENCTCDCQNVTGSAAQFAQQFENPKDIFSILLLVGGDVVGRAIAQLAGSRLAPVAFSFGTRHRPPLLEHVLAQAIQELTSW